MDISILKGSQNRLVFFLLLIMYIKIVWIFYYKRVLLQKLMLGDGSLKGMKFCALKALFNMTKKYYFCYI